MLKTPPHRAIIDTPYFEKLNELGIATRNLIDRSAPSWVTKFPGWHEFLNVAVLTTQTIFKTITYVSRDKVPPGETLPRPEIGITTSPMVRSMLELLFTLIFIKENPGPRIKWFHRAGWKELRRMSRELEARYKEDPKWQQHLRQLSENLGKMQLAHAIPPRFVRDETLIKRWPDGTKILDKKLKKATHRFIEHVSLLYSTLSQDHHISGGGIIRVYAKLLIPEEDDRREPILRSLKHTNVMLAITMLLSIYSEINDIGRFNRGQTLEYCWAILREHYEFAQELYALRYKRMLKRSLGYT